MNWHLLIVHFPIALLLLAGLMDLLRFNFFTKFSWWSQTKTFLFVIGLIGGFFALFTGGLIEDNYKDGPLDVVVELHEHFAQFSIFVFAFITLAYMIGSVSKFIPSKYKQYVLWIYKVQSSWFGIIITLVAIGALSATGAIGGSISHPDADPLADVLIRFFS